MMFIGPGYSRLAMANVLPPGAAEASRMESSVLGSSAITGSSEDGWRE